MTLLGSHLTVYLGMHFYFFNLLQPYAKGGLIPSIAPGIQPEIPPDSSREFSLKFSGLIQEFVYFRNFSGDSYKDKKIFVGVYPEIFFEIAPSIPPETLFGIPLEITSKVATEYYWICLNSSKDSYWDSYRYYVFPEFILECSSGIFIEIPP